MPSGAGPPAGMLYLRPKSPSGPPGLWLAERMRPPSVLRARITAEAAGVDRMPFRSEEHTSELQSLMRISYAVFCLKKKINTKQHNKRRIKQYENLILTHLYLTASKRHNS